jgi:hypothetical protein
MSASVYKKLAESAAVRALNAEDAGPGEQVGPPGRAAVAYALLEVADAIRATTQDRPR